MNVLKRAIRKTINGLGYDLVLLEGESSIGDRPPVTGTFPTLDQTGATGSRENYFIQGGYQPRTESVFFDDTGNTDLWQRVVYQFAREIADRQRYKSVCDIGCGSGYKLLQYFSHLETIGLDISPTWEWLCETYPDRIWQKSNFSRPLGQEIDLVIASDVIEHLTDPDALMKFVSAISCRSIIFSTPDRNLRNDGPYLGPPTHVPHIREWSFAEFEAYVGDRFKFLEHFTSNAGQCTQCLLCEPRNQDPKVAG